MPRNMILKRKIVLVTGSTDGVGRLVARQLADQGARVLIHGRNTDRGKELVEQIRAARGSAVFLPADFSSLNEVRRLAYVVPRECDRLDLLINNAGIGSWRVGCFDKPTPTGSMLLKHQNALGRARRRDGWQ